MYPLNFGSAVLKAVVRKSSVYWDVNALRSIESQQIIRRKILPPFSVSKS
jgi:hypothetical protein